MNSKDQKNFHANSANPKNIDEAEKGFSIGFEGIDKPNQQQQKPQQPQQTTVQLDEQNQWGQFGSGLSDKVIRIKFIRKVYLILTAQLVLTFGSVLVFVLVPEVKEFATSSVGFYFYIGAYVAFVAMLITFFIMQCFKLDRKTPYNYLLLIGITIALAYMLSMISAYHKIEAVLMALGCTFLVTIGVTAFAMQTKFDFTDKCWLPVVCLSFAMIGFAIVVGIAFRYNRIMQGVYGGIGALLMALFLAIDTQALVGNKRYSFSPEEYVNAALQLYLDICNMFLYLLRLFGATNQ